MLLHRVGPAKTTGLGNKTVDVIAAKYLLVALLANGGDVLTYTAFLSPDTTAFVLSTIGIADHPFVWTGGGGGGSTTHAGGSSFAAAKKENAEQDSRLWLLVQTMEKPSCCSSTSCP